MTCNNSVIKCKIIVYICWAKFVIADLTSLNVCGSVALKWKSCREQTTSLLNHMNQAFFFF